MQVKIINKININILYFCKLSRKNYFLSRRMTRQNHSHYEQGAGRGCESLGYCCTCPDTKKANLKSRMWVSMKAYYLFRGACFPLCFDLRPLVTVDEFQNLPRNGADSNFKKLPVCPSNDELIMDS